MSSEGSSAASRLVDAQVRAFELVGLAMETDGAEVTDALDALTEQEARDVLGGIVVLAAVYAAQLPDEAAKIAKVRRAASERS